MVSLKGGESDSVNVEFHSQVVGVGKRVSSEPNKL